MKRTVGIGILLLAAAAPAMAFDEKEDIKAAAQKLVDAPNYSWSTTIKNNAPDAAGQPGARFAPGPIEGKSEKNGISWFSMKQGDNTIEGAMKGDKFAYKVRDMWIGTADLPGGGAAPQGRPDPSMFMGRMLKGIKPGAQGVADALEKVQNLKSEGGGVYSGEFSPEGAKDQLTPKVDGQPALPNVTWTDTKGTVKFWIKDGMLSKIESTLQGKMTMGQRERVIDRTTTIEFKDVGSTKIELPDEAKKKLE
jgi:hypothetical protein